MDNSKYVFSSEYLTDEDVKILQEIRNRHDIAESYDKIGEVRVGDIVQVYRKGTDTYGIGLVIMVYDGSFYIKVLENYDLSKTKRWKRYGLVFNGLYISPNKYSWEILHSCYCMSYETTNSKEIVISTNGLGARRQTPVYRTYKEQVDIYYIPANYCNGQDYAYAMLTTPHGKYGEFCKGHPSDKYVAADAVRRARIRKIESELSRRYNSDDYNN